MIYDDYGELGSIEVMNLEDLELEFQESFPLAGEGEFILFMGYIMETENDIALAKARYRNEYQKEHARELDVPW